MQTLIKFARRFRDDEHGVIAVEFVLVVPILVWVFLSTFVYFDVYRVQTNALRATITIAEIFSREDIVDAGFVDTAEAVLKALTYEEANPDLRVTVYHQQADGDFRIVWSENRNMDGGPLGDNQIDTLGKSGRLPPMDPFDHAVFLETRTEYDAPFNIGLGPFVITNLEDRTFTNDMVIRPRGPRLCFETGNGPDLCGPGGGV